MTIHPTAFLPSLPLVDPVASDATWQCSTWSENLIRALPPCLGFVGLAYTPLLTFPYQAELPPTADAFLPSPFLCPFYSSSL